MSGAGLSTVPVHLDVQAQPPRLVLAGSWTIAEVSERRADLVDTLSALSPGEWRVDLAGVDEIDTAGVQLLMSAARAMTAAGADPVCTGCPASVQRVAAALGAARGDRCLGMRCI